MNYADDWFGSRLPPMFRAKIDMEIRYWYAHRREKINEIISLNERRKKPKPIPNLYPEGGFRLYYNIDNPNCYMLIANDELKALTKSKMRKIEKLYTCMIMSYPAPNTNTQSEE